MKFELTILGSGGAIPTVQKNPTSQFLNIQDRYFLIDCGEGTQIQLRKYKCKFSKLDHIFISHLHGDHYLGLIGFLSSMNLLGRTREIHLYSPVELQKILDLYKEISGKSFSYDIIFHPLSFNGKDLVYEDKVLKVYSFPVSHSIPCCGFLFKENSFKRKIIKSKIKPYNLNINAIKELKEGKDYYFNNKMIKNEELTIDGPKSRSYAYCADTKYNDAIVKYISNVDLLYHEATFLEDQRERAIKTFHSTAKDAGKIAHKSGALKLLIGHFSARYNDLLLFEEQAKQCFKNSIAVKDGDVYNIRH